MFGEYEITFDWRQSCWCSGRDLKKYEKPYSQPYKLPSFPFEYLEYEDMAEYVPEPLIDEYDSSSDSDLDY